MCEHLRKKWKFDWLKDLHGQEQGNAWIRKVPDDTVIDEVEAFAKE